MQFAGFKIDSFRSDTCTIFNEFGLYNNSFEKNKIKFLFIYVYSNPVTHTNVRTHFKYKYD